MTTKSQQSKKQESTFSQRLSVEFDELKQESIECAEEAGIALMTSVRLGLRSVTFAGVAINAGNKWVLNNTPRNAEEFDNMVENLLAQPTTKK